MRLFLLLITLCLIIGLATSSFNTWAAKPKARDISHLVSKDDFARYSDVADFIEQSPKVTINVTPSKADIEEYGPQVAKSLTGSDCDRDGKMDDNPTCNAVFYKLWLKYAR